MAEGYVVFDPVLRMYYQGDTVISEEYDNVRLWAPWEACAKVFETQEDAMKHCPDLAVVIKVNAETMEVIE